MRPNKEFVGLSKAFWANIRTISQEVGYTVKPKRQAGSKGQAGPIRIPTLAEMHAALESINLSSKHLIGENAKATGLGKQVFNYFEYRADLLNRVVERQLMVAAQAKALYEEFQAKLKTPTFAPMNKQSGDMKK